MSFLKRVESHFNRPFLRFISYIYLKNEVFKSGMSKNGNIWQIRKLLI
jgi:hypothetical protein